MMMMMMMNNVSLRTKQGVENIMHFKVLNSVDTDLERLAMRHCYYIQPMQSCPSS